MDRLDRASQPYFIPEIVQKVLIQLKGSRTEAYKNNRIMKLNHNLIYLHV